MAGASDPEAQREAVVDALSRIGNVFAKWGSTVEEVSERIAESARWIRFWSSIDRHRGRRDLEPVTRKEE